MIDPTFSFQKRFEDEVPLVLRALNYPFSISKSALSAVGSPHTWPTLLGVLTWLMNLLQYDELRKERVESDAALDPSSRRHKLFYENTVEAYAQFLGGADEFPELNKELDDHFSSENKNRGAEITKLENDRDELSNTLDALRTQPSPLELINEHKTSLETNIRKFNLLIPSLLEHAASVNKKIVEKDSEVEREKRELEALGKGKGRLLDVLARQEEAAIDAECISKDREMLREALNTVSGDRAGVETTLSETEGVVARVSGGLEENVKAFNREIEQLGLGEERRLLISREPTVTDADSIVVGVKEAVKVLRELKEHFVGRIPGLQEEALKLQEETDEVEEKLILMRHEQNVLKSKKEQLEAEYLQKKESMNDALTRKSDWIMKREEDIRSTKDSMRERIRESDSRILALKEQLAGFEEQFAKERRRISAIVTQDVDKFRQHQRSVRHSVITVRRHFEEQLKAEK